jgi:putative addiction module killer protein
MVDGKYYRIQYYTAPNGVEPVKDWIDGLRDKNAQARIISRIDRLGSGLFGDCEPISNGVHELRIHIGKGYRVYFGNEGENIILLLEGGNKKTQKRDIKSALDNWDEYKT